MVNGRVKIRGRVHGGYRELSRSGPQSWDAAFHDAAPQCARSSSMEIFMHSMIARPVVIVSAILLAACADPVGPGPESLGGPAVDAACARPRRGAPIPSPDSVGIPPSIPPIYEQLPGMFGTPQ
jgi:hypothetical protein